MILFDMPPPPFSDIPSIATGISFFLIFTAIAIVSFVLLKKNVRTGFRLIIATIILIVAVVGSIVVSFITAQVGYKPKGPAITRQSGTGG